MNSKVKILGYLCTLTIIIVIFVFSKQQKIVTLETTAKETEKVSTDFSQNQTTQLSSSDLTSKNQIQYPPQSINSDLAKEPFDVETKNSINNEQFKEITQKMKTEIYKKMRVDEIKSLKESIVNDQKLLKKIEDSGTGIEDYKFIQQNLKKRIDRLKLLE